MQDKVENSPRKMARDDLTDGINLDSYEIHWKEHLTRRELHLFTNVLIF